MSWVRVPDGPPEKPAFDSFLNFPPAVIDYSDLTDEWKLEQTVTLGPGDTTPVTGLLLAPSILGPTLFGAEKSPGREIEKQFGTISLLTKRDESYAMSICMPSPPYPELGGLVVGREVSHS